MRRLLFLLSIISFISLFAACGDVGVQKTSTQFPAYSGIITPGTWIYEQIQYRYDGIDSSVNLQIYFPKDYVAKKTFRTVIALHGYRGKQNNWQSNTNITALANQYSIVIVCPSMGSTLYESTYFPETTNKWGAMPGGLFIPNVLIPYLQKTFYLATNAKRTGIMGNSTGGRGAILAAARNPELFGAAAGLSGDYDPVSMPRNRILTSVYGSYKEHEQRWQTVDNPMYLADGLKSVPLFLGHGDKDQVVPKEQSLIFAVRLNQLEKGKGKHIRVNKIYPYKMHNWEFWARALYDVMGFFDENLTK